MPLGLSKSIVSTSGGDKYTRSYIKDNLKLYMPYRGTDNSEVQFVGTGSTSLDGLNDYIDFGSDINLGTLSTISLWVGGLSSTSDTRYIFGSATANHFELRQQGAAKQLTVIMGASGDNDIYTYAFDNSDWTHLAFVRISTTQWTVYINGVLVDTLTDSDWSNDDTKIRYIGRNSAGYYLQAKMKNVALWNRALTATEVQNVMYKTYAEVSGRLASGLVSWWALDATSLGSNILGSWTNSGSSPWTTWNAPSATSVLEADSDGSATMIATNPFTAVSGKIYQPSFNLTLNTGSLPDWSIRETTTGTIGDGVSFGTSTSGANTGSWAAPSSKTMYLFFSVSSVISNFSLSDISIKEVQTEDLKGSNDGTVYGATIDTDLYGSDTPVKPRAVDNSPKVQADAIGSGSASFTASNDDYIDCGDAVSSINSYPFSVTGWFKAETKAGDGHIFTINDKSTDNVKYGVMVRHTSGEGELRIFAQNTTSEPATTTGANEFNDDNWHHFASVYESATNMKLYADGVHRVTQTDSVTFNSATDSFVIGIDNENSGLGKEFQGEICQVGIWQGALTQEKIQSIMEKTFEELTATEKSSLGSELVTNGTFDSGYTGWTASSSADLSSVSGGRSGNCFKILEDGSDNPRAYDTITTVANKVYKFVFYHKDIDSVGTTPYYAIWDDSNSAYIYGLTLLPETISSSSWVRQVVYFATPSACTSVYIYLIHNASSGAGTATYFDDVSVKEVTHDLVSYWALDEGLKTLSFDSNDRVETGADGTLADATYSWWMKASDTTSNRQTAIFGHGSTSIGAFHIQFDSSRPLLYMNSSWYRYFADTSAQDDGKWHHWMVFIDADDITGCTLYVDGVAISVSTTSTGSGSANAYTQSLTIGSHNTSASGAQFLGEMAQFAVWSGDKTSNALAMTNEAIDADWTDNYSDDMTGYWKMDNASTVTDLSGQGNNGTVVDATLVDGAVLDKTSNNNDGAMN